LKQNSNYINRFGSHFLWLQKMAPKLVKSGSFRHGLTENEERLLSGKSSSDISQIGIGMVMQQEEQSRILKWWNKVKRVTGKAWEMGRSDPRKIIFSAKTGLALTLLSLLIFLREPFKDMSLYCVWAILTVVVVFEFSIGTCIPN